MPRTRRPARPNPSDPNVTYWVGILTLLAGATAIWAYKNMSARDRAKAGLPG